MTTKVVCGVDEDIAGSDLGKMRKQLEVKKKESTPIFSFSRVSSHLAKITITIADSLVQLVWQEVVAIFQRRNIEGFGYQSVPTGYLEEAFKNDIDQEVNKYFLNHLVFETLFNAIAKQKIIMAHYPRLNAIIVHENGNRDFIFDVSLADELELKEWRHFLFKSPRRKRYKDLDKQVMVFLEDELVAARQQDQERVEDCDWVCFKAVLLDHEEKILSNQLTSTFWMQVKNELITDPCSTMFFGKKQGDAVLSAVFYQGKDAYEDEEEECPYRLRLFIDSILKGKYLVHDHFKSMFRLKNKMETYNKLMEVFSYRNDQSQRKAIIEELFHLLLTKHRFEVPKHLVLRRQEDLLLMLSGQPDYHVYKSQEDFAQQIELLAEKQLKEEVLTDQIAYREDIIADSKDVQHYLSLFNNKRLFEFVYFKPLLERLDRPNTPINEAILKRTVLREKTLNHIIYHLTQ